MEKNKNQENFTKVFVKKSYKKPVLKNIGNVLKTTAGTGGTIFDNGSNASAGKRVS